MNVIKKMLSLVATTTILMSFAVMPQVEAAGEVSITPVVEVKLGDASYVAYDGQALSAGDKVRIKYEYAGPETSEIWSEPWYDEDNDIDYPAELKGGKSIVLSQVYIDYLDKDYFTAGAPTFFAASTAAQWLTKDATYATTGKDPGIAFASMSAFVNGGIYKNSGRIAQIVYTLSKDLDKDVVVGPADFNYQFKLATADIEGTETGSELYTTGNGGVVFNTVTLKAGTVEPPAEATLVEEDEEKGKGDLETKEDGKKYYTQGFMATLTLNGQTVNAVNFKLKNKDVTIDSADNDKNVEGWSAPFEGEAPFVFAINVVNVPDGETVTCDWYME